MTHLLQIYMSVILLILRDENNVINIVVHWKAVTDIIFMCINSYEIMVDGRIGVW